MDTSTVSVLRRPELVATDGLTRPEAVRKLTVKAIFLLSESGRKAGHDWPSIPRSRDSRGGVLSEPDGSCELALR